MLLACSGLSRFELLQIVFGGIKGNGEEQGVQMHVGIVVVALWAKSQVEWICITVVGIKCVANQMQNKLQGGGGLIVLTFGQALTMLISEVLQVMMLANIVYDKVLTIKPK